MRAGRDVWPRREGEGIWGEQTTRERAGQQVLGSPMLGQRVGSWARYWAKGLGWLACWKWALVAQIGLAKRVKMGLQKWA